MAALEESGLLYQPHTSAGRMPTDAGYRYFVEEVMPDRELSKGAAGTAKGVAATQGAEYTTHAHNGATAINTEWLCGGKCFAKQKEFSEFGLRSLLEKVDRDNLDDICALAESLDYIDERCDELMQLVADGETKILIGEDNPFAKTKNYSMIVSQFDQGGEKGIVALIGPKNMKYERTKSLIEYVKKILGGSGAAVIIMQLL